VEVFENTGHGVQTEKTAEAYRKILHDFIDTLLVESALQARAGDEPKQVLLLATYHFQGSTSDSFSTKADNVLSDKRQDELALLLDQIALFEPTKIVVEQPRSAQLATDADYERFLKEGSGLGGNEVHQVGFRLAQLMGHERIYAVDESNDWFIERVTTFALDNGQGELLDQLAATGQSVTTRESEFYSTHTLLENFVHVNQPELLLENHRIYVDVLARIGKGDNHIGADLVADWYKRNIKIFANVTRFAEPGDRILMLYGQGHVPILTQLFSDASDFERIDALHYLVVEDAR
jgi:hypothetical protein